MRPQLKLDATRRGAAYSVTERYALAVSTKKPVRGCLSDAMSQIHYLPLTPGFFAILVGNFVIVVILRSVRYAKCMIS